MNPITSAASAAVRTPAAPTQVRRMTLDLVRQGRRSVPGRTLLHGIEGVGKSSFGAEAPAPIFITPEEGVSHLEVSSFPQPETFEDVLDCVRTLTVEQHDYKTVVFDTLDWIEPLVFEAICRREGWKDIEAPGYGKGYALVPDEWRKLLALLEQLQAKKQMEVIFLAHTSISTFSNPRGPDFSRYEMKLHKKSSLLKEWTRNNLFAMHEEFISEEKKTKGKGVSTGQRVMYTERTAAYDAKNRDNLPPMLPLSYAEYAAACAANRVASPEVLRDNALALLEMLAPGEPKKSEILNVINGAAGNASKLAAAVNRLRVLVAEKENAQ